MDYAIEVYRTVTVLNHGIIKTKNGHLRRIRNFYRFLGLYPTTVEIKKDCCEKKGEV